jgi:hypothetical protein
MKAQPKTRVIEIKEAPVLKNPFVQQGIRDLNSAKAWGEKNGHAVVYFMPKKQKVYADRLKTDVAAQAEKLEEQSVQLVMFAESDLS